MPPPERRFDIDWLRVIAIFLLIPFHTGRIFDDEAPANVEAERPGRLQVSLRVGLAELHIFGRYQHVRNRKPRSSQSRTHERL